MLPAICNELGPLGWMGIKSCLLTYPLVATKRKVGRQGLPLLPIVVGMLRPVARGMYVLIITMQAMTRQSGPVVLLPPIRPSLLAYYYLGRVGCLLASPISLEVEANALAGLHVAMMYHTPRDRGEIIGMPQDQLPTSIVGG